MRSSINILVCAMFIFVKTNSHAAVATFTNRAQWQSAVGFHYSQIGFTGFPDFTTITTQYQHLGITFTDGNDKIDVGGYPNDGAGLDGWNDGSISLQFQTPIRWIAVDHPGLVQLELYSDNALVYTSPLFGGGGRGFFAGLVADMSFNRARVFDPSGGVFIDDLYFGPPIPAPGAAVMVVIIAALGIRRRARG